MTDQFVTFCTKVSVGWIQMGYWRDTGTFEYEGEEDLRDLNNLNDDIQWFRLNSKCNDIKICLSKTVT